MGDIISSRQENEVLARANAVIGILIEWAAWQRGYRIRIGYSPKSAGFQSGGVVSEDTASDNYATSDVTRYEIVDACVDDLPPCQHAAIYHRYCASVFRGEGYESALLTAHERLARVFRAKGIMW